MSFRISAGVALTLAGAAAHAGDINDTFSIRSYGTLGIVHSDNDQADYVSGNLIQPRGAGYSDPWSTDVDSKLALQLDARLTDRLSAVVQLVSEASSNNSWDGDANKRYVPSLMDAEFRKVGFARHWIRPPVEVYGTMPFNSTDGIDITHRAALGSGSNGLRAHYGVQSLRTETTKAQVTLWGVSDTLELGDFVARVAYLNTEWQSPGEGFGPLFEGFAALAGMFPSGQAAANEALRLERSLNPANPQKMENYSLGLAYDPGDWFVQSEITRSESSGMIASSTFGYVTGGYRFGGFTPYATFSRIDTDSRHEEIPLAGLPRPALGLANVINGMLDGMTNGTSGQQTIAVGVRWDFMSGFALKAQYDRVDLDAGSTGLFANEQPGFEAGSNVNVFGLALDYVF